LFTFINKKGWYPSCSLIEVLEHALELSLSIQSLSILFKLNKSIVLVFLDKIKRIAKGIISNTCWLVGWYFTACQHEKGA